MKIKATVSLVFIWLHLIVAHPLATHAQTLNAQYSMALVDRGTEEFLKSVLGATRLPDAVVDPSRVPAQVRVITKEEIRKSGARSLQELLRSQPGIVLYDQVGNAFQETVDLRGFNATPVPATAVIVDGVRVNEPDFGQVNFHLIPLETIEKIEILPGPSTVFGKNALGGVIHIFTQKGTRKTQASAETAVGSYGRQKYRAMAGGPLKALEYRITAGREQEDGYRINSGAKIHALGANLSYRNAKTDLSLSYSWADDFVQQAGSLTPSELEADRRQNVSFVRTDSLLHGLTMNMRQALSKGFSLALNTHYRNRLENTPLNRGRTSLSNSRSAMEVQGFAVQLTQDKYFVGRRSVLTAGIDYDRHIAESYSGGSFSGFPFTSRKAVQEDQVGMYVQENVDLIPKTLILTGAVRYDLSEIDYTDRIALSNSGKKTYNRVTPRLGLNYNIFDSIGAYAVYSEAFRVPTADEISALGPFTSGPLLKPVKAQNYELGAKAKFGAWGEGNLSLFRTEVQDEIFAVFDPTAGFGQNRNIDKSRRQGFELSLKPKWKQVDGFLNYSYTEATFQTDFNLDKAPFPNTQQVKKGDFIPQVPKNRLAAGANFHLPWGLTFGLDGFCVGSQHVFGDESNTEPRLGAACALNAGGAYEKGPLRIFLRADNVLDRKYESRGILGTDPTTFQLQRFLVPAPGFTLYGGLSYRLDMLFN